MTRRTATQALDPTVLKVREPGDILGVIPYLLGFHPSESLVAAFVRQRRIVVTARIDLAVTADVEALLDQLEQVGEQVGTRSVVLIGYSGDAGIRELMRDLAALIPLDLVDVLAVSGERWWSVCCEGDCCPPEGRPYDISSHPLAAAAVLAGISATATRQEIADLAAGPPPADHDRLAGLAEHTAGRLAGVSRRRRQKRIRRLVDLALQAGRAAAGSGDVERVRLETSEGLSEAEAIELAVLARDVAVRDAAWAQMTRARATDHVDLWRQAVAVAVQPYEAAPLGMLAVAGWLSGNGALLNCCIDRLESVAPDYSLLELCQEISDRAIPPAHFDLIGEQLGVGPGQRAPSECADRRL